MIDDEAQKNIREAYEKTILKEGTINEDTIRDVADIFTRFLIGDRKIAIRQLKSLEKSPIKGIDGTGELIDRALDPKTGDMTNWNKLFGNLRSDFTKVIEKQK